MGSALVDPLGDVGGEHVFEGLVGGSGEVFVDQVKRIPLVVDILVERLGLPVGVEGLVQQLVDVHVEGLAESLFLHVLAANRCYGRQIATYPPYP